MSGTALVVEETREPSSQRREAVRVIGVFP
jgi:hypothetical protein